MTSLSHWLNEHCQLTHFHLDPLPGDASFRRYFRVHCADRSYIAMDASVEKHSCAPFVAIAKTLRKHQLQAPEIFASDCEKGYLLLSDLGHKLYLNELNSTNAKQLYTNALNALYVMQQCQTIDGLALKFFTAEFMYNELNLFKEWFLLTHLSLTLSDADHHLLEHTFKFLSETAASQPVVFMHRDYHSANLMVLPSNAVGILDFQDAFLGPITYDLASLLRDCYISWPDTLVMDLVTYYWEKLALPNVTCQEFLRWFDLMGVQRHLKALLTFSRKYRRDHNANYLQHIPRTLNYVLTVSQRYPECHALHRFLQENICVE